MSNNIFSLVLSNYPDVPEARKMRISGSIELLSLDPAIVSDQIITALDRNTFKVLGSTIWDRATKTYELNIEEVPEDSILLTRIDRAGNLFAESYDMMSQCLVEYYVDEKFAETGLYENVLYFSTDYKNSFLEKTEITYEQYEILPGLFEIEETGGQGIYTVDDIRHSLPRKAKNISAMDVKGYDSNILTDGRILKIDNRCSSYNIDPIGDGSCISVMNASQYGRDLITGDYLAPPEKFLNGVANIRRPFLGDSGSVKNNNVFTMGQAVPTPVIYDGSTDMTIVIHFSYNRSSNDVNLIVINDILRIKISGSTVYIYLRNSTTGAWYAYTSSVNLTELTPFEHQIAVVILKTGYAKFIWGYNNVVSSSGVYLPIFTKYPVMLAQGFNFNTTTSLTRIEIENSFIFNRELSISEIYSLNSYNTFKNTKSKSFPFVKNISNHWNKEIGVIGVDRRDRLIAYYDLAKGIGNRVGTDDNYCSVLGVSEYGNCIQFNGVIGYIFKTISDVSLDGKDIFAEFLVNAINTSTVQIIWKIGNQTNSIGIGITVAGTLALYVRNSGSTTITVLPTVLELGIKYYVAVSPSSLILMDDGLNILDSIAVSVGFPATYTGTESVGASIGGSPVGGATTNTNFFNGNVYRINIVDSNSLDYKVINYEHSIYIKYNHSKYPVYIEECDIENNKIGLWTRLPEVSNASDVSFNIYLGESRKDSIDINIESQLVYQNHIQAMYSFRNVLSEHINDISMNCYDGTIHNYNSGNLWNETHVEVSEPVLANSSRCSFHIYFNPSSVSSGVVCVLHNNEDVYVKAYLENSKINFVLYDEDKTEIGSISSNTLSVGTDYLISLEYDGTATSEALKIYQNGVLMSSSAGTGKNLSKNISNMYIGCSENAGTFFSGTLSNLIVSDKHMGIDFHKVLYLSLSDSLMSYQGVNEISVNIDSSLLPLDTLYNVPVYVELSENSGLGNYNVSSFINVLKNKYSKYTGINDIGYDFGAKYDGLCGFDIVGITLTTGKYYQENGARKFSGVANTFITATNSLDITKLTGDITICAVIFFPDYGGSSGTAAIPIFGNVSTALMQFRKYTVETGFQHSGTGVYSGQSVPPATWGVVTHTRDTVNKIIRVYLGEQLIWEDSYDTEPVLNTPIYLLGDATNRFDKIAEKVFVFDKCLSESECKYLGKYVEGKVSKNMYSSSIVKYPEEIILQESLDSVKIQERHISDHDEQKYPVVTMDNLKPWENQYDFSDIYISALSYSTELPYPIANSYPLIICYGQYIYVFGGQTVAGSGASNTNKAYRATLDQEGTILVWDELPELPYGIAATSGCVFMLGDTIHIYHQDKLIKSKITENGDIGSWSTESREHIDCRYAVVIKKKLYFMFGYTSVNGVTTTTVHGKIYVSEIYDDNTFSDPVFVGTHPYSATLMAECVFYIDNFLYFMGGRSTSNIMIKYSINEDGTLGNYTQSTMNYSFSYGQFLVQKRRVYIISGSYLLYNNITNGNISASSFVRTSHSFTSNSGGFCCNGKKIYLITGQRTATTTTVNSMAVPGENKQYLQATRFKKYNDDFEIATVNPSIQQNFNKVQNGDIGIWNSDSVLIAGSITSSLSFTYGNKVYFLGGLDSENVESNLIYSAEMQMDGSISDIVQHDSTLLTGIDSSAVLIQLANYVYIIYGDKIYYLVLGEDGRILSSANYSDISVYIKHAQYVLIENTIYLFGNYNGEIDKNIYSIEINSNFELSDVSISGQIPEEIYGMVCVYTGYYLYLIGGKDANSDLSTVYRAISSGGNFFDWSIDTNSLPVPMSDAKSVSTGTCLYIFKGVNVYYSGIVNGELSPWVQGTSNSASFDNSSIFITLNRIYSVNGESLTYGLFQGGYSNYQDKQHSFKDVIFDVITPWNIQYQNGQTDFAEMLSWERASSSITVGTNDFEFSYAEYIYIQGSDGNLYKAKIDIFGTVGEFSIVLGSLPVMTSAFILNNRVYGIETSTGKIYKSLVFKNGEIENFIDTGFSITFSGSSIFRPNVFTVQDSLYILGGRDGNTSSSNNCKASSICHVNNHGDILSTHDFLFDFDDTADDIPAECGLVVTDKYVYLLGGYFNGGITNSIYRASRTLENVYYFKKYSLVLPIGLAAFLCIQTKDNILLLGGETGTGTTVKTSYMVSCENEELTEVNTGMSFYTELALRKKGILTRNGIYIYIGNILYSSYVNGIGNDFSTMSMKIMEDPTKYKSEIFHSISGDDKTFYINVDKAWVPIASTDNQIHGETQDIPCYFDNQSNQWIPCNSLQEGISEAIYLANSSVHIKSLNDIHDFSDVYNQNTGSLSLGMTFYTEKDPCYVTDVKINDKNYFTTEYYNLEQYGEEINSIRYEVLPFYEDRQVYAKLNTDTSWTLCSDGNVPLVSSGFSTSGKSIKFRIVRNGNELGESNFNIFVR